MSGRERNNIDDQEFVLFDPEGAVKPGDRPESGFNFFAFFIRYGISLVALAVLVAVGALLWLDTRKHFPLMEPGSYVGQIDGIGDKVRENVANLYVEYRGDQQALLFLVLEPHWQPQVAPAVPASFSSSALVPVTLNGPRSKYRLFGRDAGGGVFEGRVHDLSSSARGTWKLRRSEPHRASEQLTQESVPMRLELQSLMERAEQVAATVQKLREESQEFSGTLTDGVKAGQLAQQKLAAAEARLVEKREQLQAVEAKMREAAGQLQVAERVTAMGKLVSLARETLEREERWAASQLRAGGSAQAVDTEYQKAERVLDLRRQIAIEREELSMLKSNRAPRTGFVSPEDASFDDLWRKP